jgi:PAS domain S-box-containing protein
MPMAEGSVEAHGPDRQLFADVFSACPIGIVVENLDGQPLFVNPAFCSMLGFSEEELRGKHCVDFSPAEDAEKDWALFQRLQAGSIDHYQLEKRYFRGDSSLVWGQLTVSLLKWTPPLVVAMVEDITEKKTAEDARFKHAAIVESSEDAIISKNLDSVIVGWNAGAERIFGYSEAEGVGQPITILIPPDLHDEEKNILERFRAGGRIEHYETVRVTKTGKRVNVSLIISPIRDSTGRLVGFSEIAHDITERKRAEQTLLETNRALERQTAELQARQELLKIFVRNVPAGVAMLDREMRYLQLSDRFCADYSLDRTKALGRSHYELFPDLPERWKQVHRRALDGETVRAEEDSWVREGGTMWVRWEVRPWLKVDGLPGGIIIFAEDITSRKQMEQAVSDMSRKLIESQERERTRIGRELHDDINQRLALLAVELQALQQNPSNVESRAEQLREQTMEISRDVQALSHELHSAKLEYLGVVRGMKGWCSEFAERHRIEIDFKTDVVLTLPFEAGLCLFRVLQEAVHNSVKHSGVKRVEVQLMEHANDVHLTIEDRGKGFDFEAARQGRGLGLTSMQERVRLASGTIEIQSHPAGGTTIRVRVPISSEQASRLAAGC